MPLYINRGNLLIYLIFRCSDTNLKLRVDAPSNVSIIRPTSGADETENSLIINELEEVGGTEGFGLQVESVAVKKVVDSRL